MRRPDEVTPALSRCAFSLIELLCVIAIIGILASLLLGAVGRALLRAKSFVSDTETPAHIEEIQTKMRRLYERNPSFARLSLDELIQVCNPNSRTTRFLRSSRVTYFPVAGRDPDRQTVLLIQESSGKKRTQVSVDKGWLCNPPSE